MKVGYDGFVGRLCLSVGLGITDRGKPLFNFVVLTPLFHPTSRELSSIICDQNPRYAKPTDNVFPNKVNHSFLGDRSYVLSFNPLGKVLYRDYDKLILTRPIREFNDCYDILSSP